ncbi:hypothetical protein C8Q79DRAFT_308914 [Trametes meyenii]|nr:hypothetical protein C8Q79DRAFT_308914 [Trametes meyenii]
MYTRTPSSGGSYSSSISNAPSTPSHAPRSINYEAVPPTPRTPNTPYVPNTPGSSGLYAPFAPSQNGARHNVSYGLMTPPDSPEKASYGHGHVQLTFNPALDAQAQYLSFDVRRGVMMNPHSATAPAINHPVSRMVISVGGIFSFEVTARGVPTVADVTSQLVRALAMPANDPRAPGQSAGSLLGTKIMFAGLSLCSIAHGVAYCDLHLRNA